MEQGWVAGVEINVSVPQMLKQNYKSTSHGISFAEYDITQILSRISYYQSDIKL